MLFFKGFSEIQNGRHRSTAFFFVGAKTLSQNLFTFYNHIPHDIEICR